MERIKENEKHLNTVDEKRKKFENDTSCKEEDESFAKTMTGPQSSQPMTEKILGSLIKKYIGWDEPLDEESSNTWKLLQQELREATPIKIPRCYFNGVISEDITASLEGSVIDQLRKLWNHCASKDNPADIPSRRTSPVELSNSMWFSGPEWLKIYADPSKQTSMNENEPSEQELIKEMILKKSKKPSETSSFNTTCEVGHIGEIIDFKPGEESRIEEITNNKVARRVSYLRTLKEHFWLRWKNEYLLELRNVHRQKTKRQKGNCIKVGDVVVIHEENVRRVKRKLGRIEKLIEGKDGAIRGAVVRKLTDKGGKCTEIRRPIQKLYPVELSEGDEEIVTAGDNTENASEKEDQKTGLRRGPIREAARKAQAKRQELIESGRKDNQREPRRERFLTRVLNHFWERWRKEYLTELREQHKVKNGSVRDSISQGHIVVVHEDKIPRQLWKVGRVENLMHGRDGNVRAATIRTSSGGRVQQLQRPIQRLHPIGISTKNPDTVPQIKFVRDDVPNAIQDFNT
ncbi:Hypothetical predicted protein [Paramuricea clavata]|uniref:Uncharacterized protein n=1 Tax=Paramuricea clavata TaxID=317549 RepID=A0A7D9ERB7_PARCT|nr:Hypothetical predicted protein [Paramuricea clavata]